MKPAYLLLVTCLFFSVAHAQDNPNDSLIGTRVWKVPPIPTENDRIVYGNDVRLGGDYAKDRIYSHIYDWFRYNMKSNDVKITAADKAGGHIAGLGKITYNQSVVKRNAAQGVYFNYDIWIRNGGYKYRIFDIKGVLGAEKIDYSYMYQEELHPAAGHEQWSHKYRYEMLSDMNSFITLMIKGIEAAAISK